MCGRFSIAKEYEDIVTRFEARLSSAISRNYNAAPTQNLPVVTNEEPGVINIYRWGLIPFWAKDASIGNKMINARAETITEKPSYKSLIKKRRCLVISDGFYEWERTAAGKMPYYITLDDGGLYAFAGLWDSWKNPEGKEINSFTIITTEANELVRKLHNRMPVILKREDEKMWLDEKAETSVIRGILKPYPSENMRMYRVSQSVNSVANNSPELIEKVG